MKGSMNGSLLFSPLLPLLFSLYLHPSFPFPSPPPFIVFPLPLLFLLLLLLRLLLFSSCAFLFFFCNSSKLLPELKKKKAKTKLILKSPSKPSKPFYSSDNPPFYGICSSGEASTVGRIGIVVLVNFLGLVIF